MRLSVSNLDAFDVESRKEKKRTMFYKETNLTKLEQICVSNCEFKHKKTYFIINYLLLRIPKEFQPPI